MHPPPRPDGKIESVVTSLEMLAKPSADEIAPPRAGLTIMRAVRPTISFYRYLYDTVGEPWLWSDRRKLSDEALGAIIEHADVAVHVLYADGVPAGYVELDARDRDATEIAYLGMMPEFIGQKLGPYLLDWGIRKAWSGGTSRLWVHTCTLDHPSALGLYQRAGFRPFKREVELADDPRVMRLAPSRIPTSP
jgi:GNAT superfamily N-acetyltransferase